MTPPPPVHRSAERSPATESGSDGQGRLAGNVASGVRLGFAQQIFEQVVRFGLTVVLARLIAPEDFGLMSMAFVVTYLAILLSDLGVGAALIQRPDLTDEHVETAFTASSLFGLLLTGLAAAGSGPIGSLFREPELPPVILALSLTFLFKGVQGAPRDLLRRHMLFVPYTLTAAAALLVGAAAGVVVAVLGYGVWALVAYSIVESALGMVFSLFAAVRAGVWRPSIGFDRTAARDLASFTGYMMGVRLLAYGQSTADNVLVGRFLGATALGFYGLAYRIMLYPIQKIADVVGQVALPAFSTLQHDRGALGRAFLRGQQAIALVCVPLSVGVVLVAPEAIRVALGSEWAPATAAVQILAMAGPFIAVVRLNSSVYQATGRPSWAFWMLVASTVLNVIGFVFAIRYGIEGVAAAFTVTAVLVFLPHLVLVSRTLHLPARSLVANLAPVLGATIAMALAVSALRLLVADQLVDVARLALFAGVGAVVYLGSTQLLAPHLVRRVINDVARRKAVG